MKDELFEIAAKVAEEGTSNQRGGPFGAVIADKNGNIISVGCNRVLETKDPTNHAEIVAIREACKKLNSNDLRDYTIYSTCEPCPMCLSAIIWSNIKTLYFSSSREDAAKIGFKDKDIYDYLNNQNNILNKEQVPNDSCKKIMDEYQGELY